MKGLFGDILPDQGDDDVQVNGNQAADLKLRHYQVQALEQIDAVNSAIYVLPTAGGKTVIFAFLIKRLVERGERVLILCHREEILDQTSRKLQFLGLDHGVIFAGRESELECNIQLAAIQTLTRRVGDGKIKYPRADVVVVDECQHARAVTWQAALNANPYARRYGFSATPCRGDGKGLGDLFDELIIGPTVAELQKEKWLVPVKYFAPAKPDLKGVQTQHGDYVINQLADRMNRAHLIGDIVTQWHRLAERRRTIVFAVDVGHSVNIRNEFIKSGVRAEHLDGKTDKKERKAILGRLASGETGVVTNCMVLTEGFDCPPVGCNVLARPTKQLGLYQQMAGRGLRPDTASGKQNMILIDHSGAVYRHGLLEDEIVWTLDVDGKASNETHERRAQHHLEAFVNCSQCGHTRERGEACPNCGFKSSPRPDLIIAADKDLVEVGQKSAMYSIEDRQRWYRELMALRLVRNASRVSSGKEPLKPGWAAAKFKDKFGEWPPFAWNNLAPASEVSAEVSSWVRSRDIAYAKRLQKASVA